VKLNLDSCKNCSICCSVFYSSNTLFFFFFFFKKKLDLVFKFFYEKERSIVELNLDS
jgi:hypothetical protein